MITIARLRQHRREDAAGYVAILMSMLMVVLFGMAAFAVDVSNWYLTGQQLQKEADAAALAGVPSLPGDPGKAFQVAGQTASANVGPGDSARTVSASIDGQPTRLRVTVSTTVGNIFGGLLGLSKTTIARTAVADYAGPVEMGSPCNYFGSAPLSYRPGSACDDVKGQFWANVGSPAAAKESGDAFQNNMCSTEDQCSGGRNLDYDANGYFYSITLTQPVADLRIEAFDPALVYVGDRCEVNFAQVDASAGVAATPSADKARNNWIPGNDEATRYLGGTDADRPYCTGDQRWSGDVRTQFLLRNPSSNAWDPLSFLPRSDCNNTFNGYNGNLYQALHDKEPTYRPDLAETFRRWVPLCNRTGTGTIQYAPAGTYLLQVKTNGLGADTAGGHNRFALRAYSTSSASASESISISGYNKMAAYANLPSAETEFFLARVPSGAAGQILNVKLFDIGDSTQDGLIKVVAPPDSGVTFTQCTGSGRVTGALLGCSLTANKLFQGKWQQIAVSIPANYKCSDTVSTGCWVRLKYDYGVGSAPSDTTSWQASIEGDPVRLVE